jgi:hypothetical protein
LNLLTDLPTTVGSVEGSTDGSVDGSTDGSVEGSTDGSTLGVLIDGSPLGVDGSDVGPHDAKVPTAVSDNNPANKKDLNLFIIISSRFHIIPEKGNKYVNKDITYHFF